MSYENTWFVTQRLIPNDFGMSNKNAGRYALGRICAFWRKQKKTTVSSDLSRPREVVASIASCARQVSRYRARVPPRYVPAAFPPSRGRSDDRSSTTADPPSRRVSSPKTRFLFSCHVECVSTDSSASLAHGASAPRAPRQAPRARRARASRRVFFAHASLTLFRATRRRAFDRRASLLVKEQGKVGTSERRFRQRKGRTANGVTRNFGT